MCPRLAPKAGTGVEVGTISACAMSCTWDLNCTSFSFRPGVSCLRYAERPCQMLQAGNAEEGAYMTYQRAAPLNPAEVLVRRVTQPIEEVVAVPIYVEVLVSGISYQKLINDWALKHRVEQAMQAAISAAGEGKLNVSSVWFTPTLGNVVEMKGVVDPPYGKPMEAVYRALVGSRPLLRSVAA